jgi:L-arabinose isomerase
VLLRTAGFVRAAVSASSLYGSRVGLVGGAFFGMGDFAVEDSEMCNRFGAEIVRPSPETFKRLAECLTDGEIEAEIKSDGKSFKRVGDFSRESHVKTLRDALALREWIKKENLSAFSVNFLKIGEETGLYYMPFMEACKAMGRGVGYAGEGDVLTAAFVGALMRGFPDSSFVEIFCPDWQGNTLLLSHMGEMNIRLASDTPEISEKEFNFGSGENPVACFGCYKSGNAVFVNIFKGKDKFKLLVSPVEMEAEKHESNFKGTVRGWMKPEIPVGEFLERLSKAGATHHSILVYGANVEQLRFFGELLDLEVVEI